MDTHYVPGIIIADILPKVENFNKGLLDTRNQATCYIYIYILFNPQSPRMYNLFANESHFRETKPVEEAEIKPV